MVFPGYESWSMLYAHAPLGIPRLQEGRAYKARLQEGKGRAYKHQIK